MRYTKNSKWFNDVVNSNEPKQLQELDWLYRTRRERYEQRFMDTQKCTENTRLLRLYTRILKQIS